jgi:hypothetical protein
MDQRFTRKAFFARPVLALLGPFPAASAQMSGSYVDEAPTSANAIAARGLAGDGRPDIVGNTEAGRIASNKLPGSSSNGGIHQHNC